MRDKPKLCQCATNKTAPACRLNEASCALIDVNNSKEFQSKEFPAATWEALCANVNAWDVSAVQDMSGIFAGIDFHQKLTSWITTSVTSMARMFEVRSCSPRTMQQRQ